MFLEFKVLIADDDAGMRLLLKKAVEKLDGFKVVNEAKDGESTLHLAEETKPDIIFMDVEMPIFSGVECAKRIMDINPKTIIIFATGHEEYMPDAFEIYAFDYLIKPFRVDRIHQTLERIRCLHQQDKDYSFSRSSDARNNIRKLLIRNREGVSFADMQDIILIQRENRSTVIYTCDERFVTSESLSELEERLDSNMFFRSHKSYIINLSMIQKIYPYGRWTYTVKLKDIDMDALLTHDKYEELQKIFK